MATVTATGWAPVVGDGGALVQQLNDLLADGYRVVVAADGAGSAARIAALLGEQGVAPGAGRVGRRRPDPSRAAAWWPRRSSAASCCRRVKLAVLAESDVTGRRRAHRRARPRRREAQGYFDDLKPGDYVVHYQHGVARYGGMVKRAIGGVERDYLLLEYRGDDRLYVPSDQIDAVRHYTGGESPTPQPHGRRRLAEGQGPRALGGGRDRPGAGRALPDPRPHARATPSAPDTPWQHELEEAFPYELTPDQRTAIDEVKADMEAPVPDGPPGVRRRRASARPRWRCGPCSRPSRTAARPPCWCPPPCWPSSTSRPSASASPPIRCASRC